MLLNAQGVQCDAELGGAQRGRVAHLLVFVDSVDSAEAGRQGGGKFAPPAAHVERQVASLRKP